jgi:cation diffusion facilitator family transporter
VYKSSGSQFVVYAALAANILIAVGKFVAAAISGSSAIWSEGIHSAVDSTNELLLLYGIHRSKARPDNVHPLGHGREVYFWSFMVAVLVLALGAGLSFYEGVLHLINPHPIENATLSLAILAVAAGFEGTSWVFAVREFRAHKGDLGYFEAFTCSKDPTVFTVLVEDSAALIGLIIAATGILLALHFRDPRFDAVASIGIGALLTATSILLARETKSLLIGEAAHPHVRESIMQIAATDPGIRKVNGLLTVQIGPDQVLAAMSAEFEDALTTPQIEACIKRIEAKIKDAQEEVMTLFVKPQTPETFQARRDALNHDEESDIESG